MAQFVPVSRIRHAAKRWRPAENYRFAATDALAPAYGAELRRLALVAPLAFVPEAGHYRLMAVLSFSPGHNWFVAPDGRWLGAYAPALYSSYPFRLLPEQGKNEWVLCVDEDGAQIVDADEGGEEFFDAQGNPSQALKRMLDHFDSCERNRKATEIATSALAAAGLIVPWPLKLQVEQAEWAIEGLHRIDERALNALSNEAFLALRKASALPLAYAQLLSTGQIGILERLAAFHMASAPAETASAPAPKSLEAIFNLNGDGLVRFE